MTRAFHLSTRSQQRLRRVHPDLVRVIRLAIQLTTIDFSVIEGRRTLARQRQLLEAGATQIMTSRHLTGHAVDLAPYAAGRIRWDWPLFHPLARSVKKAAKQLGVKIVWGGDWPRFKDGPHFELDRRKYPAEKA